MGNPLSRLRRRGEKELGIFLQQKGSQGDKDHEEKSARKDKPDPLGFTGCFYSTLTRKSQ